MFPTSLQKNIFKYHYVDFDLLIPKIQLIILGGLNQQTTKVIV